MGNISYYIFVLVALIVAFLVVKKVASCMIKTVVLLAMVVALAAIYFLYFISITTSIFYSKCIIMIMTKSTPRSTSHISCN